MSRTEQVIKHLRDYSTFLDAQAIRTNDRYHSESLVNLRKDVDSLILSLELYGCRRIRK